MSQLKGLVCRFFGVGVLFVGSVFWGACGDETKGRDACSPPCDPGEVCQNGECVVEKCDPPCDPGEVCQNGECVAEECEPPCEQWTHCEGGECLGNVCDPPCDTGERCVTHGGASCECVDPPCGDPPTGCEDGLDNDGDGWLDHEDPDCEEGDEEVGLGTSGCNDGVENDGDGAQDSDDEDCVTAFDDEVLGAGECVDDCVVGEEDGARVCALWDADAMVWLEEDDWEEGPDAMHNMARSYVAWLRGRLMPSGGVMRAWFTDSSFTSVSGYGGTRDSPIWTGTYLASESLRYMVTGAPDALAQIDETVRVMDRWWRISGDQGYLARYAAPTSSPPAVLAIFDPAENEDHFDVPFEGDTWHWKGNVSRDQYQGTLLGHSFAYEATTDEEVKEIIRANVVSFIHRLMTFETRAVDFEVDGYEFTWNTELGHCVYTDDETPGGTPRIEIQTSPFDMISHGVLPFWPNPAEFLRDVPGLGWLPDIYLRSQAIQLGSMFSVGLQVTEGVPGYDTEHSAILQHYEAHVDEWIDIAAGWANSNQCGDSYHGLNIAFQPIWNWVRLETDPARKARLQTEVLRDAMWSEVADHQNVFFGFIYASQASSADDTSAVESSHVDQLKLFPVAPNTAHPVDNTVEYSEDPNCPGLASEAIDVDDRVPSTFMWERNPWKLTDPGTPNYLYSGVDYLITYWMARHYGYLDEDSPNTCLRWRDL